MCGQLKLDDPKLQQLVVVTNTGLTFAEDFKPGSPIPAIKFNEVGEHELVSREWGWGTQERNGIETVGSYNARQETWANPNSIWRRYVTERLIVPVSSFKEGASFFSASDGSLLFLAGIGNAAQQVSIFTQPANEAVLNFHHRMPVFTTEQHIDRWLYNAMLDFPPVDIRAHMRF